jgi:phage shock protein PspC (stress-responsive transcriptional regulator)
MTDAPYSSRFFAWIRSSGIRRGGDRWLAGVCGAIARRTGLDPLIVRGIAIVVAILGGPVLFAYAVGWALLPDERGRIQAEQAIRGIFEPAMIVIGALLILTFVPVTRGLWWQGPPLGWGMPGWLATTFGVAWGIAVTVGLIWLVVYLLRRMPYAGTQHAPGTQHGGTQYAPDGGTAAFAAPTATSAQDAGAAPFSAAPTSAAPTFAPPTSAPASDDWRLRNREWRERARQARAAERARWHEQWHRQRHPGAGFSAIVLGLAIVIGAACAAIYSGVTVGGAWSPTALLIGLAVALGVLAIGMVISGIRGRDSGAMGGFAFLAVLGLIVIGVFPGGTQFVPFGAAQWSVSPSSTADVPGYALIGGQATVDLTGFDHASSGATARASITDVWVGFGETDLILPADRPVRIETNLLAGNVDTSDVDRAAAGNGSFDHAASSADPDRGGVFFHEVQTFNAAGANTSHVPVIRVWSFAGSVNIISER